MNVTFVFVITNLYIMNSGTEYTDSEFEEDVYEDIGEDENYGDKDYIDKQYYIGLPFLESIDGDYILASSVYPETFYKNDYEDVYHYLFHNSVVMNTIPQNVELMQMQKKMFQNEFEIYNVVLKTFWIKLIQRTWRTILKKRAHWLKTENLSILRHRERGISVKYPPALRGMLSYLRVNK